MQKDDGPLRVLLVKPQPYLLSSKRLKYFLNLEPLELEIVAGASPGRRCCSHLRSVHRRTARESISMNNSAK